MDINKIEELDKKLEQIQRSTRTLFPSLERSHNFLRQRFNIYYKWHLVPYAHVVHWATLFVFTAAMTFFTMMQIGMFDGNGKTKAADGIAKTINYQGKLTNTSNVPVADGNYNIAISIYDSESGGNRLWTWKGTVGSPTAVSVAVSNGIFSVLLGDTSSYPGTNAMDLNFNSDSYYLGVTVEGELEMTPRKRIGAVGYAFNADAVDNYHLNQSLLTTAAPAFRGLNINSGTIFVADQGTNVGIGTTAPGAKLEIAGGGVIMTNNQSISSRRNGGTDTYNLIQSNTSDNIIIGRDEGVYMNGLYLKGGNQNVYLQMGGTTTTNAIIFQKETGSTVAELMRLTQGGNVGIGTTAPSDKLDVSGGIAANGAATTAGGMVMSFESYGGRLQSFNSKPLAINPLGNNIGIGTTAPSEKLHLGGTDPRIYLGDATVPAPTTNRLYSVSGSLYWNGVNLSGGGALPSGTTGQTLYHNGTGWTASSNLFHNNTNVGIGTTTPGAMLDIKKDGGNSLVLSGSGAGDRYLRLLESYATAGGDLLKGGYLRYDNTNNLFVLGVHDALSSDVADDINAITIKRADGNVGIGTTAPAYQIDVRSTDSVTNGQHYSFIFGNSSQNVGVMGGWMANGSANVGGLIRSFGSLPLFLGTTNASQALTILDSGNVGIGTTAPGTKLHLTAATGDGMIFDRAGTTDNELTKLSFKYGSNAYWVGKIEAIKRTGGGGDLAFYTTSDPNTEPTVPKLMITRDGNVGIGVTAPATKLDVDTNSNTLGLRLRGTSEAVEIGDMYMGVGGQFVISTANTSGSNAYIEIDAEDDQYGLIIRDSNTGTAQFANMYMTDAATDYLNIVVNSTTATAGLVIDDDNQVGIGVVAPVNTLDVEGGAAIGAAYSGTSAAPTNGLIVEGNVGIGTTAPGSKLDVAGTLTVSGSNLTTLGGNLTVTGTAWTATPTISGLITATSGLTANGALTANAGLTIGDASGDTVTVNSASWTFANDTNFALSGGVNGLSFDTNTLSIDATNHYVGIGTTAPGSKLDISGGLARTNGYILGEAATDNLVANGDFEQGIYGWSGIDSAVAGGYSGNFAAQRTGGSTMVSDDYIPVNPVTDVIELEAYLKKTVAGGTPGTLYFGYKAYDAAKAEITTAPCGTYCYFAAAAYVLPADGNWHKFSSTTTGEGTSFPNFPVGTKYVRVLGLLNYGASADAVTLVDHITVKRLYNAPLFVGNNFNSTNMQDQQQLSKIYTTSSNGLILEPASSGNVGIGTTAPSGKLQVVGTLGAESANGVLALGGATSTFGLSVGVYDSTNQYAWLQSRYLDSANYRSLVLNPGGGNVGIGTTTTSQKLEISGAAGPQLKLTSSSDANYTAALKVNYDSSHPFSLTTANDNEILGRYGNNTVLPWGNVGIGTTAPSEKLHLGGTDPRLYLADASAPTPTTNRLYSLSGALYWNGVNLSGGGALPSGTTGQTLYHNGSGWAASTTLFNNGTNIGIGTTAPSQKLEVSAPMALGDSVNGAVIYLKSSTNNVHNLYLQTTDTDPGEGYTQIQALPNTNDAWASFNANALTDIYNTPFVAIRATPTKNYLYSSKTGTGTYLPLIIHVGGSEVAGFDTSGNLGIGTTVPATKLDVAGSIRAKNSVLQAGTGDYMINSGTSIAISHNGTYGSIDAANWGSAYQPLILQSLSLGNVGIGTTAPGGKLEVSGGNLKMTSGNIALNSNYLSGDGDNEGIVVDSSGLVGVGTAASSSSMLRVHKIWNAATSGEQYGIWNSTYYDAADTNLKQGIRLDTMSRHTSGTLANLIGALSLTSATGSGGTTTDASSFWSRVDVATGSTIGNAHGLFIADGTGTGTMTNQYGLYINNLTKGATDYGIYIGGSDNYSIYSAGGTNYFAGNVGIGTTNPDTKLKIEDGNVFIGNSTNPSIFLSDQNDAQYNISVDSTNNVFKLSYFGAAGDIIAMNTSGNVGIGTTVPATKLDVNGVITAYSGFSGDAAANIGGTGAAAYFPNGLWSNGAAAWIYGSVNFNGALSGATSLAVSGGGTFTGNVGIGTTAPGSKLEVAGTLTVSGSNLTSLGGNLTVTGTAWTATPTISGLITATSGLTANGALTANNTFTLGDAGDTGSVNTSSWKVSTAGAISGVTTLGLSGAITGATATNTINGLIINSGALSGITTATMSGALTLSGAGTSIAFSGAGLAQITTAASQDLALMPGGNVGIGMTNPTSKLYVNGDADVAVRLKIAGNTVLYLPSNNPERGPWNPIWNSIGASKALYTDEEFASGTNSLSVYNNSGGSAVTITRETGQTGVPNSTGNWIKVSYDGVGPTNPGYGGIVLGITPSGYNKTYVQRFRAKLPAGRTFEIAENAQGTNNTSYWLTNNTGTGKWEDYIRVSHAGNTGSLELGGHVYVNGGTNTAFNWYIASINVYEVNVPMYASANTWLLSQALNGGATFPGSGIWNSSGNVGIGTTAPSTALQVNGTATATQFNIGSWSLNGSNWPGSGGFTYTGSDVTFGIGSTSGQASLQIDGGFIQAEAGKNNTFAGNVGIGVTAPAEKLHLGGTDPRLYLADASAPTPTTNRLYSLSGALYWNGVNLSGGGALPSGTTGQTLYHNGSGWAASSLLYNSGTLVGINTTAPDSNYKMTIKDATNNNGRALTLTGIGDSTVTGSTGPLLTLQNTNTTAGNMVGLTFHGASTSIGGIFGKITDHTNSYGDLYFTTRSAAGWSDKMVILSGGNVGIGTTAPANKLAVVGSADIGTLTGTYIRINSTPGAGAADGRISVGSSGSNDNLILNAKGTGALMINYDDGTGGTAFYGGSTTQVASVSSGGNIAANGSITAYSAGSRPIVLGNAGQITIQGDSGGWAYGLHAKGSSGTDRGGFGFLGSADALTYYYIGPSYSSPYMTLNNGNVGIGTTAPSTKLEVTGDLKITDATAYLTLSGDGAKRIEVSDYSGSFGFEIYDTVRSGGILSRAWDATNGDSLFLSPVTVSNNPSVRIAQTTGITFSPQGSIAMTVANGGNVGIGTTAPATTLDVNGTASVRTALRLYNSTNYASLSLSSYGLAASGIYGVNSNYPMFINPAASAFSSVATLGVGAGPWDGTTSGYFNGSASGTVIGTNAASGFAGSLLDLQVAGSSKMVVQGGGNVGIGTTTPEAILHVAKSGSGAVGGRLILDNTASLATGNAVEIAFLTDSGATGSAYNANIKALQDGSGSGYTALTFGTYNGNGTPDERMRITSTGNVGIGTTAPESGLALEKTANGALGADLSLVNRGTGTDTAVAIDFGVDNSTYANGAGNAQIKVFQDGVSGTSAAMTFSTWNGSAFAERLRIKSDGNVGIGTSTPANKLDVEGGLAIGATYSGASTAPTNGLIVEGNVGIGTSAPATKLEVSGTVKFSTSSTSSVLTLNQTGSGLALDVQASGSSLLMVSDTAITMNRPVNMTAAGDVSIAYDLQFTGGVNYIKSEGPLYISSGDPSTNSDLVLSASGSGLVVIDDNFEFTGSAMTFDQDANVTLSGGVNGLAFDTNTLSIDATNDRVGIGTTAPSEKLHLGGTDPRLYLADASAPTPTTNRLYSLSGALYWNGVNLSGGGALPSGTTGQTLYHNGSGWAASSNLFHNGTNVGIGTSVPQKLLDVNGTVVLRGGTIGSTPVAGMYFSDDGATYYMTTKTDATTYRDLVMNQNNLLVYAGGTEKLRLNASGGLALGNSYVSTDPGAGNMIISGNLGIGTTSTSNKLNVVGTAYVNGTLNFNGNSNYSISRTLDGGVNDWTDIGTFASTGNGTYIEFYLRAHFCGVVASNKFRVDRTDYAGSTTDWIEVPPIGGDGHTTQHVAVDVRLQANNGVVSARLRTLSGCGAGNAGTVYVDVATNSGTFTASTSSGTGATVATGYLASNVGWKFPLATDRFTATTQGLYLMPSGNVGIGTTAPGSKLQVASGTINRAGSGTVLSLVGAANVPQFDLVSDSYGIGIKGWGKAYSTVATGYDALTIDSTGNNSTGVQNNVARIRFGLSDTTNGTEKGYLAFDTASANSYSEALRINSSGNVGIGTTVPGQKLEVAGSILSTGAIIANSGSGFRNNTYVAGYNPIWSFNNATTYGLGYYQVNSDILGIGEDAIGFHFGNTSTPPFYVSATGDGYFAGNVGVGTTAPLFKLSVSGETFATSGFRVAGPNGDNVNNAPWYGIGQSNLAASGNYFTQLAGYYGLLLKTGGGTMAMDYNGNVGIGLTNPTYKLDVSGTLHATGAATFDSTVNGLTFSSTAISAPGALTISSTGSNAIALQAGNGTVSLNKASTNNILKIYGSGGTNNLSLTNDNTNSVITSSSGELQLAGAGTNQFILGDNGAAVNLVFEESSTISGQGTNTITMGVAGDTFNMNTTGATYNVGTLTSPGATINTTSTTTAALTVNAPSGQTANILDLKVNGVSKFAIGPTGGFNFAGGLVILGSSNITWDVDGGGNIGAVASNRPNNIYAKSSIKIGTALTLSDVSGNGTIDLGGNLKIGTSALYVSGTNGNVGIGTTNPLQKFQVKVATNENIYIRDVSSAPSVVYVNDAASAYVNGSVEALNLALNAASGGNVGIGLTNPEGKLHITGGHIILNPQHTDAGDTGQIQFRELAANGTEYVAFKAPDAISSSVTLTLPVDDGTNGQVLITDGSGVLSWAANSATGMSNPMTTTGDIIYGSTTATPANPARLAIGSAGQCLVVTGGLPAWGACTGTSTAAGNNTEIQFNNSGSLGAAAEFAWDNTNKTLSVTGTNTGAKVSLALLNSSTGTGASNELRIGNNASASALTLKVNGGNFTGAGSVASITNVNNAALTFGTNNTEKVKIEAGGNVGIGTTNANILAKLQVGSGNVSEPGTAGSLVPAVRIVGANTSNSDDTLLRLVRDTYSANLYGAVADFKMKSYGTYGSPYSPKTQLTFALKSTAAYAETANVDVMTLRDDGTVGIGTTAPSSVLDIYENSTTSYNATTPVLTINKRYSGGSTIAAGFGAGLDFNLQDAGNNANQASRIETVWEVATAGSVRSALTFSTKADTTLAERMRINGDGLVGIGTTTLGSSQLEVAKTWSSATGTEQYGIRTTTTYSAADNNANAYKQGLRISTDATHTSGTMAHLIGGLAYVTANGSGGTTTDAAGYWSRVDASTGATITNSYGYLFGGTSGAGTVTNQYGLYISNLVKGATDYGIYIAGSDDYAIYAASGKTYLNGNVGIGVTNPLANLHVSGSNVNNAVPVIGYTGTGAQVSTLIGMPFSGTNNAGNALVIQGQSGGAYTSTAIATIPEDSSGASGIAFYNNNSASFANLTEKVRINNAGNMGIGTTAPGYKLTVNGTAWVTSGAWSGSDARWKENITPIEGALGKITQLEGVTFTWNKTAYPEMGFTDGTQLGLIAQQVEQVVPEVVTTSKDGYKAVEYGNLAGLLIEGIKEQQGEIEQLAQQVNKSARQQDSLAVKLDSLDVIARSAATWQSQDELAMNDLMARLNSVEDKVNEHDLAINDLQNELANLNSVIPAQAGIQSGSPIESGMTTGEGIGTTSEDNTATTTGTETSSAAETVPQPATITNENSVSLAALNNLVIKGIASATGNLFEIQDSNGGLLFAIGSDGKVNFGDDVNIYKANPGQLKTDASLLVAKNLEVGGGGHVKGAFFIDGALASDSLETQRIFSKDAIEIKSGDSSNVVITPGVDGKVKIGSGENNLEIDANGVITKNGLAVSNRGMETFRNLRAANKSYIRNDAFCTGSRYEETKFNGQPDVPRIVSLTAGSQISGKAEIWGTTADGATNFSETLELIPGKSVQTTRAYARIDKVILPETCPAGAQVDVGITDLVGLSNLLHGQNGVYKVTKNGVDISIPAVDVNASTIDLTPLVNGDEVTVWYKY